MSRYTTTLATSPAFTFNQYQAELGEAGIRLQRLNGEYRVSFLHLKGAAAEPSAYYTDDLHDAFWTGKHMAADLNSQRGRGMQRMLQAITEIANTVVSRAQVVIERGARSNAELGNTYQQLPSDVGCAYDCWMCEPSNRSAGLRVAVLQEVWRRGYVW